MDSICSTILLHKDITEEFHLVYQPIVEMTTGKIISLESLIRWVSPIYGIVGPSYFIPLIENSEVLPKISRWVISTVFDQLAIWQKYNINISINISPKELESLHFLQQIISALHSHRVPRKLVSLEVTERNLYDNFDCYITNLKKLNKMDIRVKLDDFGIGNSGLLRLLEFPFKELKLDIALIPLNLGDTRKIAVCRAIAQLSSSLGFSVVAEGVETELQRDILVNLGIKYGQGYYFAKPMLPEIIEGFLVDGVRLPIKKPALIAGDD